MAEDRTIYHFIQGNPVVELGYLNIAKLLRRIADSLDNLGDVEIHDLTLRLDYDMVFDSESIDEMLDIEIDPLLEVQIVAGGPDPMVSVYYSRPHRDTLTLAQSRPPIRQAAPASPRRVPAAVTDTGNTLRQN